MGGNVIGHKYLYDSICVNGHMLETLQTSCLVYVILLYQNDSGVFSVSFESEDLYINIDRDAIVETLLLLDQYVLRLCAQSLPTAIRLLPLISTEIESLILLNSCCCQQSEVLKYVRLQPSFGCKRAP